MTAPAVAGRPRVLVGGIGYRYLRDHTLGVAVVDHLALRDWPENVVVEDLSYGPIAVLQRLEDEAPDRRFDRLVVVSAVPREGVEPGTVTCYRWDGVLPPPDEIQRAVADAVTGVILMDNTLIVAKHFGALPDDVVVVEVEPEYHEFGATFGPTVAPLFDGVCELVTALATRPTAVAGIPFAPLGAGRRARLEV
jgi:hydrogenase maturation protease